MYSVWIVFVIAQVLSFGESFRSAPDAPIIQSALDATRDEVYGRQIAQNTETNEVQTSTNQQYKGTLFLIGGDPNPKGILADLVKLAGKNAKIAIVCQASEEFDESAELNAKRFVEAGIPRENLIIITKPGHVFHDKTIKSESDIPSDTTVVFFAGGAQKKLKDDFTAKQLQQVDRILREGGIVAGSSAGASVMSREMIEKDDPQNPSVPLHSPGFGLLDKYIIDTHVAQRGREERDVESLHWGKGYSENAVIAIDENTGVAINMAQKTARVYGHKDSKGKIEGQVHVFLEVPALKTESNIKPYVRSGAPKTGHQAYEYDIPNGGSFALP